MPRIFEFFGVLTHAEESDFMVACKTGNYNVVKKVLVEKSSPEAAKAKANKIYTDDDFPSASHVKFGDAYDTFPLLGAAHAGCTRTMELLLDHGANPNIHGGYHAGTALHLASSKGDIKIVKILLKKGALHDVEDGNGHPPLFLAIGKGDVEMVKLFIEHGADVDIHNAGGKSALDHAISSSKQHKDNEKTTEIVKFLLEQCVVATVRELHTACECEDTDMVALIGSQDGINVNQPINGSTALHVAAACGRVKVVQYLLTELQADANQKNKEGQTALEIAEKSKSKHAAQIVEILQESTDTEV